LAVFAVAVVISITVTTIIFLALVGRSELPIKAIVGLAAANMLFCILFPVIFGFALGRTADGAPDRSLATAFLIMIGWTVLYSLFVLWRIVVRSREVASQAGVPEAAEAEAVAEGEAEAEGESAGA